MENEEKQNITVKVAGNVFPLEIIGSQEEFYRTAENIFKQKIEYYEKKYTESPRTVCFLRYINSIDNSNVIRELEELL